MSPDEMNQLSDDLIDMVSRLSLAQEMLQMVLQTCLDTLDANERAYAAAVKLKKA
ncbi:MAG TPA: hypothetical protein VHV55_14660 [Pirellulales bacterium]|jgi:hypothetical protein|nr:hypothetical protein [Pirellulales bacterium]